MSHALLLRLFLSPFFSVHVAIQYLKTYPASIGITHYLTGRLRCMPTREVEFYWPQLCHLLITRPTDSNALECFILERAEESTHSAMLTFWFMQAALCDLAPSRIAHPRAFLVCQRVLLKCHEIIFGDPPPPPQHPYQSQPLRRTLSATSLKEGISSIAASLRGGKVKNHIAPAVVGMSVMLASAPGTTALIETVGAVAVTQGQRERDTGVDAGIGERGLERVIGKRIEGAEGPRGGEMTENGPESGEVSDEDASDYRSEYDEAPALANSQRTALGNGLSPHSAKYWKDPTALNVPNSTSLSRSFSSHPSSNPSSARPIPASSRQHRKSKHHPTHQSVSPTASSFPFTPTSTQNSKPVDPFEQEDSPHDTLKSRRDILRSSSHLRTSSYSDHPPSKSVPSFHGASPRSPTHYSLVGEYSIQNTPEYLLSRYPPSAQTRMLRSHYLRSEVRFLISLEEICNRLLVIPKPARLSALRAELTSLNHLLPAEVCMPTWCAADHGHEEGGETAAGAALQARGDHDPKSKTKAHDRIVRISPGDAVVLNSAERCPFLIHVEILIGDLDFDPTKRANRELLKKIVTGEEQGKGMGAFAKRLESVVVATEVSNTHHQGNSAEPSKLLSTIMPEPAYQPDLEEVDLVEQIYGNGVSIKDEAFEPDETFPAPSAPKNKAVDIAVWGSSDDVGWTSSASTSRPMTPATSRSFSFTGEPLDNGHPLTDSPSFKSPALGNASTFSSPTRISSSNAHPHRNITLDDYSDRMRTAAVMLAQLNSTLIKEPVTRALPGDIPPPPAPTGALGWLPGAGWTRSGGSSSGQQPSNESPHATGATRMKLQPIEAAAIRDRIMKEMIALEEERVERMAERVDDIGSLPQSTENGKPVEDEGIVRRELSKSDPSAAVFSESWTAKKSRIKAASPWGHLANWDVLSVIVKTGADLRQEQFATQLIERFMRIWAAEKCSCWVRYFRILITGDNSGLVETITDSVSVHSIKKAEYGRRLNQGTGGLGHVSLLDHFINTYGDPKSGRFARAQHNFIKSLAGYSVVTYLLQIKDRHNGNILVDRDGHCIHIDFGFMLTNSPGNMGFEAAPFKLTMEYVDIMGGLGSPGFNLFKKLFKEGFEAARKHSDEIITMVDLMGYNSNLPCFAALGDQTATQLRDRFQLGLTTAAIDEHLERLVLNSIGSSWTRLYDSYQYYKESVFA